MKRTIFKGMMCLLLLGVGATSVYAQQQQRKDTLVVARDGTGEYRNIQEAVEAVRAFMDYTVTIYQERYIQRKTGHSFLGKECAISGRKRRKNDYHLR